MRLTGLLIIESLNYSLAEILNRGCLPDREVCKGLL